MTILNLKNRHFAFRHARPCAGHPRLSFALQDVDGRDEPGHDELFQDELIQFDATRNIV
jgi:hypothetical protein